MEFTNEIFFNKPLKAENTVIITYCGKLYREHSKDVSIVYGYGENWEYTDSAPMVETENGFEVTLTLRNYNIFNFCFTNSFNIWDNNFGCNYIASIEPNDDVENNTPKIEDQNENTEEASSSSPVQSEENEENQEETNEEENKEQSEENSQADSDIEAAFAQLLDSLLDDNKKDEEINISELSGFGLQSVDEIDEKDEINCDEIFSELFDELTKEDDSNVEKIEENNVSESEQLDDLTDNLIASIQNEDQAKAEDVTEKIENVGLPAVQEKEDWLDKFINASYSATKKFFNACKKFGKLVKLKAIEYGFISDNNNK